MKQKFNLESLGKSGDLFCELLAMSRKVADNDMHIPVQDLIKIVWDTAYNKEVAMMVAFQLGVEGSESVLKQINEEMEH